MAKAVLIAITAAVSLSAAEPNAPLLRNPGFEPGDDGAPPAGWFIPDVVRQAGFRFEASGEAPATGPTSGRLWREAGVDDQGPPPQGTILQALNLDGLRGHRIRFSALLRNGETGGAAGLWLAVDGPDGQPTTLDNSIDRVATSRGWTRVSVEAYVPADARGARAGLVLRTAGDVRIDDAQLEDLGPTDPVPTGEAKAYLDRALDLMQQHHLNSAKADWPALRARAYAATAGATRPAETYAAIRSTINALGERHTFLRPPPAAQAIDGAPVATGQPLPTARMVGGVAVIALPRLHSRGPDGRKPYQAAIRDILRTAEAAGACGWMIDLRGHTGGDMYGGVWGLSPLLGPGPHGRFVAPTSEARPWMVDPDPGQPLRDPAAPVAVLFGPRTGSAGEDVAIAFAGRPATRTFGQPSAGLTTANTGMPLPDGAVLALTTALIEDRTGHVHDGPLVPDETVPLDQAEAAATAWLAGQGCSGAVPRPASSAAPGPGASSTR